MNAPVRSERKSEHAYNHLYQPLRRRLLERCGSLNSLRLLDFGCGYEYPLLVLFQDEVAEVTGVDVSPVFRDGCLRTVRWYGGLRKPGTAAEVVLDHWEAIHFYRHLERRSGQGARHRDYRILQSDGRRIPVADGSYDCVVSNAVLQELPLPLEHHAQEMARVLAPGGCIDLEWHNFYSWSGHYMGAAQSRAHPWGHLTEGRYHPKLNRLTPDQVVEAFSPWFTDLRVLGHDARHRIQGQDPDYEAEGTEYLTPELETRLADYPREWLLTRGFILQGRRR